ncbi:hypothetical protein [Streptomyces capitiformicae]|uniref:Uncharacterized protein n=1 Tax=Streptomyces capitiformicae TaxID=2014920 RepID=A0A919GDS8_9ACTN|nr:hypothetical protein [Streptomyces capitiformicae]GHH82109.1 hypothetical protein GCM10017771_05390 [Streptomyces capitiformicae]
MPSRLITRRLATRHLATRRLATVVVAGAASLAVLAPAASAADSAAAAKLPAKLTVKSYTGYLKAQKTPEAKKALKSFSALPAAKKAKFLKYLQDREVYEAMSTQTKGTVNRSVKAVRHYDANVKFNVQIITKKNIKDPKGPASLTFSVTESIYNIPVTTETLNLRYNVVKGKVVAGSARATAEVKNVNAAIAITNNNKVTVNKKGIPKASTTWKATPRVASFGPGVKKLQEGWAQSSYWAVKLVNR